MKTILLASVLSLLSTLVVATEQPKLQPKKSEKAPAPLSTKNNPCAQYGPGFVQAAGTTTCIKVGGGVSLDSGGRR